MGKTPHLNMKNWAPGMHLWGFRRAGIQIWDLWMLKMSDTGNHNESSPIPNSVETVIPKPSKPCVTLQDICERCVYFAVQRIFPRRGSMTRSHPQPSPFGSVHVLLLGTIKQGFLLNISVKILDLTLVLICILQILKVKWSLYHAYGRWPNSVEVICTLVQCTLH